MAFSMMGTATASLSARSSAAWPPRLKIPTRYPVLPRLRVGMAFGVAGFEGSDGSVVAEAGMADCAMRPAVTAVPVLRKSRRLVESFRCMRTSHEESVFLRTRGLYARGYKVCRKTLCEPCHPSAPI